MKQILKTNLSDIKRVKLMTTLWETCPKCGQAITTDEATYLSYPIEDEIQIIGMYCGPCDEHFDFSYIIGPSTIELEKC